MSEVTMDEISIQIEGNSDKAVESLTRLTTILDKLTGATKTSIGGLQQTNQKIKNIADNAKKAQKGTDKSFGNMGKSATNFVTKLAGVKFGFLDTINYMSSFISTYSGFNKVLGTSKENLADAEKFVRKLTDAWYLDEQQVRSAMTRYYSMTSTMGFTEEASLRMSKNLTQLSYDLQALGITGGTISEVQNQLASALRGEAEGLAKFGVSLNQATLQSVLYENGINRTVSSLNAAQKAEVIYYQIMKQTYSKHGYYAEQLSQKVIQPAMAMQIFKNQVMSLARAIGSILIPIITKILPYLTALTQMLTQLANKIASFFGFKIGDWGADLDNIGSGIGNIGDNADKAGKKIKGMLGDFDELHTISFDNGGAGAGAGAGGSLGLDPSQFEYSNKLLEVTNEQLEKAKDVIGKIGTIIAGFSLGGLIGKFLEWIGVLEKGHWLVTAIGGALMAFGVKLAIEGITEDDLKKKILAALSVGGGFGLIVGFVGKSFKLGLKAGLTITIATLVVEMAISMVKWWNEYFEEQKQKIYGDKKELDLSEIINVGFSSMGEGALNEFGKLLGLEDFSSTISQWAQDNKGTVDGMVKGMELSFDILNGDMAGFIIDLDINWSGIKDTIVTKVEETATKVSEKFGEMKTNATTKFEEFKTDASTKLDEFKTNAGTKIDEFKTNASTKFQEFKTNASTKFQEIKTNATNKFQEIKTNVTNKINETKTNVTAKFEEIKKGITDKINSAKEAVKKAIDAIKGFFKFEWSLPQIKIPHFGIEWDTQGAVAKAFQKIGLQGLPKLKVDWFAEGGFPTKGDLFVANEAGAEWVGSMNGRTAVANQDQISTGIRQAAYEGMKQALAESDFGGVNVYNYLDSKDIASKMTKVKKSNEYMYG